MMEIHPVMFNMIIITMVVMGVLGISLFIAWIFSKISFMEFFTVMFAAGIIMTVLFFVVGAVNGIPIGEILKAFFWLNQISGS